MSPQVTRPLSALRGVLYMFYGLEFGFIQFFVERGWWLCRHPLNANLRTKIAFLYDFLKIFGRNYQ